MVSLHGDHGEHRPARVGLSPWQEGRRQLRAGALGDPLRAADRGVAKPQRLAPDAAVVSELMPCLTVNVELVECLAECAPVRHRRGAARPPVRHPRREHATRQALKAHAAHVARPAELTASDVGVDGVDGQPLSKLLGGHMVSPHVQACNAAHVERRH